MCMLHMGMALPIAWLTILVQAKKLKHSMDKIWWFGFELCSAQQEAVVAQIIGIVGFGSGAVVPLCLKCPQDIHFLFLEWLNNLAKPLIYLKSISTSC